MGGLSDGAHASSSVRDGFVRYVSKYLEKYKKGSGKISSINDAEVKNMLFDAIARVNHTLYLESVALTHGTGMGTTVASILVIGKKAYVCHVGDSRVYAIVSDKLLRITSDHSLVQHLLDTKKITPEEAEAHPNKNVLIRAIGTDEFTEPDISVRIFAKASCYLICSDGLNLHVSDSEIEEQLKAQGDPREKVQALLSLARERGERDNTTALVISSK
jgi:protein phosphatase